MLRIGAHDDAGPRPWASLSISGASKTSNKVVILGRDTSTVIEVLIVNLKDRAKKIMN